jgi:hypothetical protein
MSESERGRGRPPKTAVVKGDTITGKKFYFSLLDGMALPLNLTELLLEKVPFLTLKGARAGGGGGGIVVVELSAKVISIRKPGPRKDTTDDKD